MRRRHLTEAQLYKAISLNRYYAQFLPWADAGRHKVGWIERFSEIAELIGVRINSSDERAFAKAVARWQSAAGLAPDGTIGMNTWGKMEPLATESHTIVLNPPLFSPSPYGKWNPRFDRNTTDSPMVMPARAFMLAAIDVLNDEGPRTLTRKIGFIPTNFIPRSQAGFAQVRMASVSAMKHLGPGSHARALSLKPTPWLETAAQPFGIISHADTPLLIDVHTIERAGGRVVAPEDLVTEFRGIGDACPGMLATCDRMIDLIRKLSEETIIGDSEQVTGRPVSKSHEDYVARASMLWSRYDDREISKTQLQHWLGRIDTTPEHGSPIGKAGRVITVLGVVLAPIELGNATDTSWRNRTLRPIASQVVRRVGGWAGSLLGGRARFKVGELLGIEVGPGAIATGEIGALVFSAGEFFSTETLTTDPIYEN